MIVLEALGVRIGVQGQSRGLEDQIRAVWRHCLSDEPLTDEDPIVMSHRRDDAAVLEDISQLVTAAAITSRAGDLLMLHAAAVADQRGRAVVLVGPSGMGKTTAAIELGRRWGYVTDETVAVNASGDVLPYPKPLSRVLGAGTPKQQCLPEDVGLRVLDHAVYKPVLLVLLNRGAGDEALLRRVDKLEGMARLTEQCSFLLRMERPLLRLSELVDGCDGVHEALYTDATELADLVSSAMGRAS